MITLYGMSSPNVRKVVLMLEETGLAYEFKYVDVFGGEQFNEDFRKLNPNSKVPVLVDPDGQDGELHLFESGAILIYLAEKTGQFFPKSANGKHIAIQWVMFQMGNIGPALGNALHFRHLAPPGNDYGRGRFSAEARNLHDVVEARLGEARYIAGEEYSIADMSLVPWLANFSKMLGIDLNTFPNLSRWLGDVKSRPAYDRLEKVMTGIQKKDMTNRSNAAPEALDRYYRRGRWASD